ncbi:hypothetical protein GWI33_009263 [Rhynchophorus ferrugineus]|uniref:Uncharacterized protein n=1 Tax=Rhynchophorus ferrugineus TaxID=354439 RepID=A0A834IB02_RHYFE|nr:hypothetical protein GWI33_009263 [Rhynchophorus ferrugineus]
MFDSDPDSQISGRHHDARTKTDSQGPKKIGTDVSTTSRPPTKHFLRPRQKQKRRQHNITSFNMHKHRRGDRCPSVTFSCIIRSRPGGKQERQRHLRPSVM